MAFGMTTAAATRPAMRSGRSHSCRYPRSQSSVFIGVRDSCRLPLRLARHRRDPSLPAALYERGDEGRPAGLVAGAEPGSAVAVEVLVEWNAVAPVRVVLELLGCAEHRTAAIFIAQEDPLQPRRDFVAHFEEGHPAARAGRALHLQGIAVVRIELVQ